MQHAGRAGIAGHARSGPYGQPAGHGPPLSAGLQACSGCRRCARARRIGRSCWTASRELYLLGAKIDWQGFDRDYARHTADPAHVSLRTRAVLVRSLQVAAPLARRRAGARAASAVGQPRAVGVADAVVRGSVELSLAQVPDRSPGAGLARLPGGGLCGTGAGRRRAGVWPGSAWAGEPVDPAGHVPARGDRTRGADRPSRPKSGGLCSFETYSLPAESESAGARWSLHACGALRRREAGPTERPAAIDLDEVRSRSRQDGTRTTSSTKI